MSQKMLILFFKFQDKINQNKQNELKQKIKNTNKYVHINNNVDIL